MAGKSMKTWFQIIFVLVLALFIPSTVGLLRQNCMDMKTFSNVESSDVKEMAGCALDLFQKGSGAIKGMANVYNFVDKVVFQKGTISNPIVTYAALFSVVIVTASYYHAAKASEYSLKAQFMQDRFSVLLEAKLDPILKYIDKQVRYGDMRKFMGRVCDKTNTRLDRMLEEARNDARTIQKELEGKLQETARTETQGGYWQWLSGAGGTIGVAGIMLAPCPFTAFLACPVMIAGAGATVTGATGFVAFGQHNKKYQDIMQALNDTRIEAVEAEKTLEKARIFIALACTELPPPKEAIDFWARLFKGLISAIPGLKRLTND